MIQLSRLISLVRLMPRLGSRSMARVALYRARLILGWRPNPIANPCPPGFFFSDNAPTKLLEPVNILLFNCHRHQIENIPDWHTNPFTLSDKMNSNSEWTESLSELSGRDVKLFWEFSRFSWAPQFALAARNGDPEALMRLESWLRDWVRHNPPHRGINWACGQEAAIRVINLSLTAKILEKWACPSPPLAWLIKAHMQRIRPTLSYAIGQDNNHGTSEAAALFIGGSWLATWGNPRGRHWARSGRRWLENRARHLIGKQGSSSQYSLNYHRVILDTFCMAEVWRVHLKLPAFSATFVAQTKAATEWLRNMLNPVTGDGPNVGANDGTRLLQLSNTPFRDHRPTVQLAMALFANHRVYGPGPWDDALRWLDVDLPSNIAGEPTDYVADDGGFAVLRRGRSMAMLRYPRFEFRPSQADALHLDVWLGGINLLRDAGTYSYSTDSEWMAYFGGTASHNTVQFDGRDQMPRLSRFLLGDWLKTDFLEPLTKDEAGTHFGAGYTDAKGASHRRQVNLQDAGLRVVDQVSGFSQKAVLRWRFMPGSWQLEVTSPTSVCVTSEGEHPMVMTVTSSVPFAHARMVEGWESRHYLEKTSLPVLELEIQQAGIMTTELHCST